MTPSLQTTNLLQGEAALQWLKQRISKAVSEAVPVFLLADTHTRMHCLPVLEAMISREPGWFELIEVQAGEQSKSIEKTSLIWRKMLQANAGRDAILLCLGGGMITDLGGFAASVYKRGISLIHLPTSLLAMVDAAIGGKTAIDYMGIKNPVGSFYHAEAVLLFPQFLKTLPKREYIAGLAEIKKYSYIGHANYNQYLHEPIETEQAQNQLIMACAAIKQEIVGKDPTEKGLRKILNFGHTVGHAVESFSMDKNAPLLHGEAVAIGIFCELWLSAKHFGHSSVLRDAYIKWYQLHFKPWKFDKADIPQLLRLMQQDKKNKAGRLVFVLIEKPGLPHYDIEVHPDDVAESLVNYLALFP